MAPGEAWEHVAEWLDAPAVWIPQPGKGYADILGGLIVDLDLRGNLVADAALAAICIENGLEIVSADSDFARFPEISCTNPVGA